MAYVLFTGWRPGLHKVALDRLLHEKADMSLREAHDCVTRLLAGEQVSVSVPTLAAASALAKEARTVGADARVIERGEQLPAASPRRDS